MELALATIPDLDLRQSALRVDVVASIAALSGLAFLVVAGWAIADLVATRRANDDPFAARGRTGSRGAHREPEHSTEACEAARQTLAPVQAWRVGELWPARIAAVATRPSITGRNAHRTSPITCHRRTTRFP
jgi:hypothetical protein